MPQISVIVPVYKVEKYIHRCVDSILNQTFTDFELILVDDGSPDNCGAICDEYAAKDSRVVVIHQENGGLSAARNAGIDWSFANSDSQWLSFIDSDDWVHPEYLRCLLNAAVEHNLPVSICGYVQTDGEEPEIIPEDLKSVIWNTEDFYVEHNVNATVAWGKIYQKECFQSIRYPVGKIHEDEFVTYRILLAYAETAVLPAPLYAYYVNNHGITKSKWNPLRLSSIEAVAEQIQYMRQHGFAKGYWGAAKKYVYNLAVHISHLKKCDADMQQRYMLLLTKKLKRGLLKYRQAFPFKDNIWVYDIAFPQTMQVYWLGKLFIDRITKIR